MKSHSIPRVTAKLLIPYILVFALYVQFHGDTYSVKYPHQVILNEVKDLGVDLVIAPVSRLQPPVSVMHFRTIAHTFLAQLQCNLGNPWVIWQVDLNRYQVSFDS